MAEFSTTETGGDGTRIGKELALEIANRHCSWLDVRFELGELVVGKNLDEVSVGNRHDRG